MSITLLEFRTECRQRADMEDSEFVTDVELTGYINNSISELHDMLIQAYGAEYYVKDSPEFTTASAAKEYDLATVIAAGDFYKLRGVDAKINNNDWRTVKPFNFNERNKNQNNSGIVFRYRLVGEELHFTPAPEDGTVIKLWYTPVAQTLSLDADSYNDFNNFSEYVIVDCTIKMLLKEESDVSVLERQKAALKRRIEEVSNNRDSGEGDSISDVWDENSEDLKYYYGTIT